MGTLGRVQDVLHRFDFLKHIKVLVLDEIGHFVTELHFDSYEEANILRVGEAVYCSRERI